MRELINGRLMYIIPAMLLFAACKPSDHKYDLKSYLEIEVDSLGNLPSDPYIVTVKNGKKELTVIGVMHSCDTLNPSFATIEKVFNSFHPNVVINEGGMLVKKYATRNKAIADNGELGLEKYLADKSRIRTVNGDAPVKEEFEKLSEYYPVGEVLLQYATERFILPYKYDGDEDDLKTYYEKEFIKDYILKSGIKLKPEQQTFAYYEVMYAQQFGEDFSLDKIDPSNFLTLSDQHHMCEVTRKSKEIRDIYLLEKIKEELGKRDKVMVIYGGWHVLVIEPALTAVVSN
jgi:hypothetical protein